MHQELQRPPKVLAVSNSSLTTASLAAVVNLSVQLLNQNLAARFYQSVSVYMILCSNRCNAVNGPLP